MNSELENRPEKRKAEDSESVESKKAREDEEEILKDFKAKFETFMKDSTLRRGVLEMLKDKKKRDEDARRAREAPQPIAQRAPQPNQALIALQTQEMMVWHLNQIFKGEFKIDVNWINNTLRHLAAQMNQAPVEQRRYQKPRNFRARYPDTAPKSAALTQKRINRDRLAVPGAQGGTPQVIQRRAQPQPLISYPGVIAMAIHNSPVRHVTIAQIHHFMRQHFPEHFYPENESTWKTMLALTIVIRRDLFLLVTDERISMDSLYTFRPGVTIETFFQ